MSASTATVPAVTPASPSEIVEQELIAASRPQTPSSPTAIANFDLDGALSINDTKSVTDSTAAQDSSSLSELSEDLLNQKPKGIIGYLERIPLGIKLIMMVAVCFAGLTFIGVWFLVLRGNELHKFINEREFINIAATVKIMLVSNQDERRRIITYLNAPTAASKEAVVTFWESGTLLTNLENMRSKVADLQKTSSDARLLSSKNALDSYSVGIPNMRSQVLHLNTSIAEATGYLAPLSEKLLDFLTIYTNVFAVTSRALQHIYLLRLREIQGQLLTVLLLQRENTTVGEDFKRQFYSLVTERQQLMNSIQNMASNDLLEIINRNLTSSSFIEVSQIEAIVSSIKTGAVATIPSPSTPYQATMNIFESFTLSSDQLVRKSIEKSISNGAVVITAIIVVFFLTVVLSIVVDAIISRTITGPWRRLNMLQELMINRFVPKEFLRLIGCTKITDVKLGKHQVKDELYILQFAIQDFKKTVEEKRMNHNQIVEFVNNHLGYFAPIVRNFRGHVDRYNKDGFVALFASPKSAIRAALELQRSVDVFNTKVTHISKPRINVAISILKSEKVLVSAIGEGDRVQGCILSDDYLISQRLVAQAFRFKSNLLITESMKGEFAKIARCRTVGVIQNGDEKMNILEVVDISSPKAKNCKEFSRGVQHILDGKYQQALLQMEQLFKESRDELTRFVYYLSRKLIEKVKAVSASLTVADTLKDASLREAFEAYCKQERSQENLTLWSILKEFKSFSSEISRRLLAQKVLAEYLSSESFKSINLPAATRNKFKSKVERVLSRSMHEIQGSQVESLMDNNFFKELQTEVEFLMSDAHKRFKTSELFQQAFASSGYAIQPSCLIVHLNEPLRMD